MADLAQDFRELQANGEFLVRAGGAIINWVTGHGAPPTAKQLKVAAAAAKDSYSKTKRRLDPVIRALNDADPYAFANMGGHGMIGGGSAYVGAAKGYKNALVPKNYKWSTTKQAAGKRPQPSTFQPILRRFDYRSRSRFGRFITGKTRTVKRRSFRKYKRRY